MTSRESGQPLQAAASPEDHVISPVFGRAEQEETATICKLLTIRASKAQPDMTTVDGVGNLNDGCVEPLQHSFRHCSRACLRN